MKKYLVYVLLTGIIYSCKNTNENITELKESSSQIKTNDDIDKKVNNLLAKMTLEEKIGQMNQYSGFWDVTGPSPEKEEAAIKYEHIKKGYVGSMLNVKEGVAHVRAIQKIAVEESRLGIPIIFAFDVIHGFKTIGPIPIAESASWDIEAIEKSTQNAAEEAAAYGINWTFAPMVDISRDARWGRVMEGGGEDPYLGSKIAVARVSGFQGDDLGATNTIAACAKHFAAYGFSESGREYNTVDVGTSTLNNIVFPPFKAATEAGVKTFMNGFNELNGIPATGNAYLQRDVLKGDWGFQGFVVSDWASMKEMVAHGYAKDKKEASELAVKAGSDMDMESYAYVNELADLVKEGIVEESLIDDAVKRILRVKFELGLFEDPYKYCDEQRQKEASGKQEFIDGILDMAKKSIVLLKNENNLLPLKKKNQKIALIGALANDKTSPLGNWRLAGEPETAVTVLEGMEKYTGNSLNYAKGADLVIPNSEIEMPIEIAVNETDKSDFTEAIALAKKSDVVVMVLGEHAFQSGEARSRSNIGLPGVQQQLLEAVYKVNKNIVLVLTNGRPLTIPWADENIPAIVEAWQLGMQSGNAIAEVLYGDYNPSGKLPMTFPRNVGQIPIYYNHKNTGRPATVNNDVYWSHYIDVENTPLYSFGYGLSYTTFSYANLRVNKGGENKIEVSVDLTNTGDVKGKEVAQLYIHDKFASITRPVRELKGFELVELAPNETKTIRFTLTEKELGFYDNQANYIVEPGEFDIYVGGNSDAKLMSNFLLE